VKGSYQPGYGVTFRLPGDFSMPFVFSIGADNGMGSPVISQDGVGYSYSISSGNSTSEDERTDTDTYRLKATSREKGNNDSTRAEYNKRIIKAAQNFILDYGDFISQLKPEEKIIVTNQGDRHQFYFNSGKRSRISVEGNMADVTALKQGKLTRDQAFKKLTVVNTESIETKEPDMEMMSSIFSRLYRPDLSQTYFTEGNVYYERLKDYGIIFYMQMVSSIGSDFNKFNMPTVRLENIDQKTRDNKVIELYPLFEKDLKENILEYGRTLKSLKDDELLVFNVGLTKCNSCGIPSTLEVSIKSSVLKDFGAGKIDKNAAITKFAVKKGANQ
jgi:hypothetical protein